MSEYTDTLRNAWFPVVWSYELTNTEPYGLQVLGYPIVLWRHKGKVVCVEDICPHRSAPLSLGRMVEGVLECKYHGWQFGEKGECTFIPSAPHKDPPQSSNCREIPSMERYGCVWVWIGEDVTQEEREKKFPEFLFNFHNDPSFVFNYGIRDIEIDHGLMVENLLDPAHLPFTHEGTLANRKDAQRMDMELVWNTLTRNVENEDDYDFLGTQRMGQRGFKVHTTRPNANPDRQDAGYFCFIAPFIMKLDITFNKKKGSRMIQLQFCVPVTPSRMRLIYYFYRNIGQIAKYIPGSNRLFQYYSDKIIDQDLRLLAGQQLRLMQGAKAWNTAVSADTGGVIYRKWRERAEKSKPWFGSFSSASYLLNQMRIEKSGEIGDIENIMTEICPSRFAESPSSRFNSTIRTELIAPKVKKVFIMGVLVFLVVVVVVVYILY